MIGSGVSDCVNSLIIACRGEERVKSAHLVSEPSIICKMQLNTEHDCERNSDVIISSLEKKTTKKKKKIATMLMNASYM